MDAAEARIILLDPLPHWRGSFRQMWGSHTVNHFTGIVILGEISFFTVFLCKKTMIFFNSVDSVLNETSIATTRLYSSDDPESPAAASSPPVCPDNEPASRLTRRGAEGHTQLPGHRHHDGFLCILHREEVEKSSPKQLNCQNGAVGNHKHFPPHKITLPYNAQVQALYSSVTS